MIERPKYLEYRHRRDQITRFQVKREVIFVVSKPAFKLLHLVGKKTHASKDSYTEEWLMELRSSDVRPDYSCLVKTQVKEAKRLVRGEEVGYDGLTDPTTEFLNETVDRVGGLRDIHGTLLTPHLLLFSEEPQKTGGEWERSRQEMLPVSGPNGQIAGHELFTVTYNGRVEKFGDNGTEFADIAITGLASRGQEGDPVRQGFAVSGNVRFALRDGHILSGTVAREMKTHVEKYTITTTAIETYEHASQETEHSVGGMRI